MEGRKRKTEDATSDMSDRPTKIQDVDEKANGTVTADISVVAHADPDEARIEGSSVTDGIETAAAVVASTIDAAALPSTTVPSSVKIEPSIDTANPPTIPNTMPVEQVSQLHAAEELVIAPKVLPKPSSPAELAYWNQMFFNLMLYRIGNGNVNVKSTDKRHTELYKWIVQLRKDYKTRERDPSESTLTEEQISVLESVRFAFTTRGEEHWQKNYEKLKEYKADHGHVLVPRQCEIPGLGDWVTSQRQQYQEYIKGRPTPLTKQRKELLDEIGFQFRIRNRPEWSSKYEELLAYKNQHGDTRVPQHFKENRALGKWVAKQREQFKLHKKGKHSFLTPDRLEKLDSIGFVWSVRGESSSNTTTETNANDVEPDIETEPGTMPVVAESNTISVVDAIITKPMNAEGEGEEKAIKDVKLEGSTGISAVADGAVTVAVDEGTVAVDEVTVAVADQETVKV